ncbi:MAG: Rieske (2Fe-2S) protein [Pirellulaceae bacterium]
MANWVRVADTGDLPPETAREFVVAGRIIALFHVDGTYFALDGICPHQGGPLGRGHVRGCVVTCPWHGWQFDVRTGQHQVNSSLRHPSFPVRIEGTDVLVDVDG